MNALSDFHFIRPGWLLLIPLAVIIWWLSRRASDVLSGWRKLIEPDLLDALSTSADSGGTEHFGKSDRFGRSERFGQSEWLLVAWLIAAVAIAGPTWYPEPSPFADDPVPVMVVMKASESMNASDLMPSRMERARLKVADLAKLREGQPTGLIAFSGSSHLVLPPTRDTEVVATMASEISPDIMPKNGEAWVDAFRLAERTIGEDSGAIIVVADDFGSSDDTFREYKGEMRSDVTILAIARSETPELVALRRAGVALGATVVPMTPDSNDVEQVVARVAGVPRSVGGESPRWAESGWWLVPILAVIVLSSFRREVTSVSQQTRESESP